MYFDMIFSSLKYQISPIEYFLFGFYDDDTDRSSWAGTTAMWRAQQRFVPKPITHIFANKNTFRQVFSSLMDYGEITVTKDTTQNEILQWLHDNHVNEVFVKPTTGQCGAGAKKLGCSHAITLAKEIKEFCADGSFTVQECFVNHPVLHKVAPNSLNTVSVVTKVNSNGNPDILFSRVRFGLDGQVDNLAAGGLAAVVDSKTGITVTDAIVTSTIISPTKAIHPVSNERIKGIQIPFGAMFSNLQKRQLWYALKQR